MESLVVVVVVSVIAILVKKKYVAYVDLTVAIIAQKQAFVLFGLNRHSAYSVPRSKTGTRNLPPFKNNNLPRVEWLIHARVCSRLTLAVPLDHYRFLFLSRPAFLLCFFLGS